jgi:pimeloyl-ACP methyl ester carboxylesterase
LHQGPVFDTYRADLELDGIERPAPGEWLADAVRVGEAAEWAAPLPSEWDRPAPEAELPAAAAEAALLRRNAEFQTRRFHQVQDVNVAYRDIGRGEPVVLLHGLAGANSWDVVAERLAMRRRVLIVETLGLGETTAPAAADYSIAAQAALARGLMSALNIESAHVVGNEVGGAIAQMFAVRWPQCCKSLTISDCDTRSAWLPPYLARIARMARLPGGVAAWAALARGRMGLGRLTHDRRFLTGDRLARTVATVAGSAERRMRFTRFLRSLGECDAAALNQQIAETEMPAMVVWGGDNACWSASWAKALYDAMPGAKRLEIIPFAGVSCHEERPEVFAGLLEEFFAETSAPASRTAAQG